ncbi:MAG: MFS transporter [Pseudomonadota bacterium]
MSIAPPPQQPQTSDIAAVRLVEDARMGRFQILAVLVLAGVNGLDGFDAFAINFASPGLAADWGVAKDTLGFVKSMNLIGMGLGSLFIAPFADRFGRRPIILASTTVLAVSMLACAFVDTVLSLSIWRVITGLGIGAMLASITAMSAETANLKYRAFCVSVSATGYLVGAVLGGVVSAELLEVYSWRAIFVFGGIISAMFVPIVAWRVPETVAFLNARRRPGDLETANTTLARMGHGVATRLGDKPLDSRASLVKLFSGPMAWVTITVLLAYFFQIITFYYFVGWVPDILVDWSYTQADAARILTAANLGGVVGGLTIGWLTSRLGMTAPLFVASVLGGVGVYAFSFEPRGMAALVALSTISGFFLNSTIVMLYALMARAFPTDIRALGTGVVLGVGRAGGVLGPILGGFLFAAGLSPAATSFWMAGGAFACAVMVLMIAPALRRREASSQT